MMHACGADLIVAPLLPPVLEAARCNTFIKCGFFSSEMLTAISYTDLLISLRRGPKAAGRDKMQQQCIGRTPLS